MQSKTKGQPSELSPKNEKLIKEWEIATTKGVGPILPYALDMYTGEVWMPTRDAIHAASIDNDPRVIKTDINLIKLIIDHPSLIQTRDDNQPIESWWWHLDKIVDHSYPADLLPQYLKEICQK